MPETKQHTDAARKVYGSIALEKVSKENFELLNADKDPGIPDEIKDKILQPFFTTKKGTEGTGLGLSITNDIIKAHGGSLVIESSEKGSIFKIYIPK
jgi:C4-dicarboxylate-specific signal transduction histidine kinase